MGHEGGASQTQDYVFGLVFLIRIFFLSQATKKKIKTIEGICSTGGPKQIYQGPSLGIISEKMLFHPFQVIITLGKEAQASAECVGNANQPFSPGNSQKSVSEVQVDRDKKDNEHVVYAAGPQCQAGIGDN